MDEVVRKPLKVDVDGRTWRLFGASYETPEGTYEFHFYALSMEHAAAVLEDIKATAKLTGQVEGIMPA